MKFLYIIFFITVLFLCSGFSDFELGVAFQPNVNRLEILFKENMPITEGVIYTKVPRGLVVSIDGKIFFNSGEARIKESSLYILDALAVLIATLQNDFVIEDHTVEKDLESSLYKRNWELSIARAGNLAEYMTKYKKLSPNRITSLGLSDYVPYRYGSAEFDTNNRIDFVIIEYEAKR